MKTQTNQDIPASTRRSLTRIALLISLLARHCIPLTLELISEAHDVAVRLVGEEREGLRRLAAAAAGEEEADGAASAFEDEVLGDATATPAAAEQDVVLPSTSSSTATKKGGNQKKAKSTITQSTRNAKEDVLGKAKVDVDEAPANGKGGKKLTKKQLYLLKKEELKRKKAEAAGGAPAPADEAEE